MLLTKRGGMTKRKVISATTFESFKSFAFLIMTNELMISMLKQANTGAELLAILDTLADDSDADVAGGYAALSENEEFVHMPVLNQNVPTLEEIAF